MSLSICIKLITLNVLVYIVKHLITSSKTLAAKVIKDKLAYKNVLLANIINQPLSRMCVIMSNRSGIQ